MSNTWRAEPMDIVPDSKSSRYQLRHTRTDSRDFGHDITNQRDQKTARRKRRLEDSDEEKEAPKPITKRRRLDVSKHLATRTTKSVSHPKSRMKPQLKYKAPCDKTDVENELACVPYLQDMFQNMRRQESAISSYMKKQSDINARMRTILLDWLVEVHHKFKLRLETFHLCVQLLDRFLSCRDVKRTDLQLVGSTCLWVASKYHEIYAPEINDFIYVSDRAFTLNQMVTMEVQLVSTLRFNLTFVIPLTFLQRYIKIFTASMRDQHRKITSCLMIYFLEHALLNYETALIQPSKLAAAVVAISFWSIVKQFTWSEKFVEFTGYELEELLPLVKQLDEIHQKVTAPNSKHHRGLKKKFSSSKYEKVANLKLRPLPPFKGP